MSKALGLPQLQLWRELAQEPSSGLSSDNTESRNVPWDAGTGSRQLAAPDFFISVLLCGFELSPSEKGSPC